MEEKLNSRGLSEFQSERENICMTPAMGNINYCTVQDNPFNAYNNTHTV